MVGSVVVVALVVVAIAAIVRGRGGRDATVQTVAGHRITEKDLGLTVEHFHEVADREGKPFPAKGTEGYERVEKISLGLLIDRAAVQAAAGRIGVHVTEAQVDARAGSASGESEGGGDIRVVAEAAFGRATARTQLITEAAFRKLTAGVRVRSDEVRAYYGAHRSLYGARSFARVAPAIRSQLLSARKNAVLTRWLAQVRSREPKPRLED